MGEKARAESGESDLPAVEQAALSALIAAELGREKPTGEKEQEETGEDAGAETEEEQEAEGTESDAGESGAEGTTGEGRESGETEGAAEDAAEEEASQKGDEKGEAERIPERLQAKIDRRIGKLVRRAREAEEKAERLEDRIRELERDRSGEEPKAKGARAASEARTLKDLEQAVDQAWDVKRWCEEHPEGGMAGEQEITAEQVRVARANAEETIHRVAPRRREALAKFAAEESRWNAVAEKRFPQLKDPESQMSKMSGEALAQLPALKAIPSWKFAAAVYATGAMECERQDAAAKSAAGTGKVQKAPAKQPSGARGGPTVEEAGAARQSAALKRAKAAGTQEALADYFMETRV